MDLADRSDFNLRPGTVMPRRSKQNRSPAPQERGSTLLEATLAIPLLLILVLITTELLLLAYRTLSVQFVVSRVMREAVLEPRTPLPLPATTYAGYLKGEVTRWGAACGVTIAEEDISICPIDSGDCAGDDPGQAEDLIRLSVTVRPQGLFLGASAQLLTGHHSVTATAVSRNEWRPRR
jgi:hypothetical protein